MINNNPLISIVVPVYNVEKYLDRCIRSLVNQTYDNIEIILVDDGSTDNSGRMCDKYKEDDKRIILIHQKNKGLSGARNSGVEIARGEYIIFVDSDDYIDNNAIKYLYYVVNKYRADIVTFMRNYVYDYKIVQSKKNNQSVKIYKKDEGLIALLKGKIATTAPMKIYKSSIVKNYKFPLGKIHEDNFTVYRYFTMASVVVTVNKALYYYSCEREASITAQQFDERNLVKIDAAKEIIEYVMENEPDLIKYAKSFYCISCLSLINKLIVEKTYNNKNQQVFKYLLEQLNINFSGQYFSSPLSIKHKVIIFILSIKLYPFLRFLLSKIQMHKYI